jgi:hypothetical protein
MLVSSMGFGRHWHDLHGAVDGEDAWAGKNSLGYFAGKKAHSVVRRCIKGGLPRSVS